MPEEEDNPNGLDSVGWFDDYSEEEEADGQIEEYDLTSSPNDFNVLTIFNFIESGAFVIPGFQRNYVWDITRASKLVESLILGLPVPQVFLFESAKNKFLVIDGQQRLMSIYYFVKQRFPRRERRSDIRRFFAEEGKIASEILFDDEYFTQFKLSLPESLPSQRNKFKGLNYSTLGEYKTRFDLAPIRNVIVRQGTQKGGDDDSAIYEIFNRLNSGGVNLRPQEIRTSLYHSAFYEMLNEINRANKWRTLVGKSEPDLHLKDVEILLRGFAMLVDRKHYAPSMIKFLNQSSKKFKTMSEDKRRYLRELFHSFLTSTSELPDDAFLLQPTKTVQHRLV